MNITAIGRGRVGGGRAQMWTAAGHTVTTLDTDFLWMVGFRFNTAASHWVRHLYLVQQASGPACAREIALQLECSTGERGTRGDAALDENWTELRRVCRDEADIWQLGPADKCRECAKTGGQSATATAEGPDGSQARTGLALRCLRGRHPHQCARGCARAGT